MTASRTLILASGSLRSLICTAMAASTTEPARITLFHIRDGRPNAGVRRAYARKQAEHYKITRLVELEMPSILGSQNTQAAGSDQPDMLVRAQIFLAAMAHAAQAGIDRILWPAQFDGDHQLIARATEQTLLIEHLAQVEKPTPPHVEMPLLDLTDAQLIELGGQLDVPWELAWTCDSQADRPCLGCASCVRRRQAFHLAGMVDPVDKLTLASPGSTPGAAAGTASPRTGGTPTQA